MPNNGAIMVAHIQYAFFVDGRQWSSGLFAVTSATFIPFLDATMELVEIGKNNVILVAKGSQLIK